MVGLQLATPFFGSSRMQFNYVKDSNPTFIRFFFRRFVEENSSIFGLLLRTACVGQPREKVNLFCAFLKSMTLTTALRIEKAFDRLRQCYSVSSGLTSEPKVIAIRHGAKVNFTVSSLKMYNEDLNTLEVFAYAHDVCNKLSA